jgi:PAS domain S-box-containing protein
MLVREITELVDSTSDSAFAADGSGRIVVWNRAAEAMFGMSAPDAMGKMCGEIMQAWMSADRCARRTARFNKRFENTIRLATSIYTFRRQAAGSGATYPC